MRLIRNCTDNQFLEDTNRNQSTRLRQDVKIQQNHLNRFVQYV